VGLRTGSLERERAPRGTATREGFTCNDSHHPRLIAVAPFETRFPRKKLPAT
jgi:hypothetical protein